MERFLENIFGVFIGAALVSAVNYLTSEKRYLKKFREHQLKEAIVLWAPYSSEVDGFDRIVFRNWRIRRQRLRLVMASKVSNRRVFEWYDIPFGAKRK